MRASGIPIRSAARNALVASGRAAGSAFPTSSEAKITEHPREVVERRVRIAGPQTLDQRRDDVVVLLAITVVEQQASARGFAHQLRVERSLARAAAVKRGGGLEDPERTPRVAVGGVCDRLEHVVRNAKTRNAKTGGAETPLGLLERPPQDARELVGCQRSEREHAAAREQWRGHLEGRVLGRRADERHGAGFDVR
jgi:hypothetical protein